MNPDKQAQDLALRAVGRNVLNFQCLEHNLKLLANLQPMEGTTPRLEREIHKRTYNLATSTLGKAIEGWRNVLYQQSGLVDPNEDLFDATVGFSFSFNLTSEEKTRHLEALKALLEERNTLIHEQLVAIDWDSPVHCQDLVAKLDAQNERIEKAMKFLFPLIRSLKAASHGSVIEAVEDAIERFIEDE